MISMQRMGAWDWLMEVFVPARRRERERKTREYIRFLVMNPSEPCVIGGHYIPHGYGGTDAEPYAEAGGLGLGLWR